MKRVLFLSLCGALLLVVTGCSGARNIKQEMACSEGLEIANRELEQAKINNFSDTVALTKASSLLTAAAIQKQFEKYPNCINKVERARYYIRRASGK